MALALDPRSTTGSGPFRRPRLAVVLVVVAAGLAMAGCRSGSAGGHGRNDDRIKVIDHQKGSSLPGDRIASLELRGDYPMFDEYLIAPGDTLDIVYHLERRQVDEFPISLYHQLAIKFVHASELNETQQVLPDGTVTLPYLGSVKVIGLTPPELRDKLEREYEPILQHPEIYVRIENFNARVEQIREDLHTSGRGLSKLIRVRPDGKASFPLVGTMRVAQRSIEDVQKELRVKYEKFMDGLEADLFMHDQTGNNIYVVGEVETPGKLQINRPINVVQAVARAGGYTHEAAIASTIVFRRRDERMFAHRFDLEDTEQFGARAMRFYLKPGDVLLMPRSRISSAAQLMREISDITFFRGWGFDVDGISGDD